MDNELFSNLIASCGEAIEHDKGNLELSLNTVTMPDDDIINKFSQLGENDKYIVRGMIERLLVSGR